MGSSREVFVLWESHINHLCPCVRCSLEACSAAWQEETQERGEWHDQLSHPGPHRCWDDTLWNEEEGREVSRLFYYQKKHKRLQIVFPWSPTLEMQASFSSICSSESCLLSFNHNSQGRKSIVTFQFHYSVFQIFLLRIYEDGFPSHQICQKKVHPPCLHSLAVDQVL